jgi:membrane fusion protein (multidrug efflux system)
MSTIATAPEEVQSATDYPTSTAPEPATPKGPVQKILLPLLLAGALGVGGWYGYSTISFNLHHESTDNAQVDGHTFEIAPKVGGEVTKVWVEDNQLVHKGDTLFTIRPDDYLVRVQQAQAGLQTAQAGIPVAQQTTAASRASVGATAAQVTAAQATYGRLATDLRRNQNLRQEDIVTQSDLDALQASTRTAAASVRSSQNQTQALRSQYQASVKQLDVLRAQVVQRQADLRQAELQLSYTVVTAPADGIVGSKSVEAGVLIQPGQPALTVVGSQQLWVTANFKETQLEKMHVGQSATVEVDAYPGVEFEATVVSLAAATGARFALLPPDNSTGNFVKVTQRVPVRLALTKADPQHPLRQGMSVEAIVKID